MSKEADNIGSVKIANDVVAVIAGLAAMEIEGVSALQGNITSQNMNKTSRSKLAKGARVIVTGSDVKAELSILMDYGYNIPTTCQKVQTRVKNALQNMTGLNVTDVDIRIAGIHMAQA